MTALSPISSSPITNRDHALNPASPANSQLQDASQDPTSHFQPISETEKPSTGDQNSESSTTNHSDQDSTAQSNADGDSASFSSTSSSSSDQFTTEEQQEIQKLQARDTEVRTHEAAHMAAAGAHSRGGPTYSYKTGPDGNRYAVGGHVSIDTSPADSPEATISKATQIRAAALAPADPSSADRSVAASAVKMKSKARAELAKEAQAEQPESVKKSENAVQPESTAKPKPAVALKNDSALIKSASPTDSPIGDESGSTPPLRQTPLDILA